MQAQAINKEVEVTAVIFSSQFEAIPRRIEFEGKTITFLAESIKKCFQKQGGETIVELSSGKETYKLSTHDSRWTLLEICHL